MEPRNVNPPASTALNKRAVDALVTRYLPLARKLAWRYVGRGEPIDDLVQVASLGLVNAARRYDERRGIDFRSYAWPMIDGELKRHFRDHTWVLHVPRGAKTRSLNVRHAVKHELEETGLEPSTDRLAQRLQLSAAEVVEAFQTWSARRPGSLDAPALPQAEAEPPALSDVIGSVDQGFELVEARLMRRAAMRRLGPRERRILYLRYVLDRSQRDIADKMGLSQAQISRALRRIVADLGLVFDSDPARVTTAGTSLARENFPTTAAAA
jgi:RNA polymerase sigma-B factor